MGRWKKGYGHWARTDRAEKGYANRGAGSQIHPLPRVAMKVVTGLTNQPKQRASLVLADGSSVSLYLEYYPQQLGWFADVAWQSWAVQGIRLTAFPNLLAQWQNVIPFGLGVVTSTGAEPLNSGDLADGTATLYLLETADLAQVSASGLG